MLWLEKKQKPEINARYRENVVSISQKPYLEVWREGVWEPHVPWKGTEN